jgi:hypothetical protein
MPEVKERAQYSAKVIKKFMSEEQFAEFIKDYNENVGQWGFRGFIIPEKYYALLDEYRARENKNVMTFAKEKNMKYSTVSSMLKTAALGEIAGKRNGNTEA